MSEQSQVKALEERAKWYSDGCDGLEDRESYYKSGDCASDAARDLYTALRVIDRQRQRADELKRALKAQDWQPIATAPRDGEYVLLGWFELPGQNMRSVGFWHSREKAWCDTHQVLHNERSHPTHWAPLLSPPVG